MYVKIRSGRFCLQDHRWREGLLILIVFEILFFKDRENVEESEEYSFAFHEYLAVPMIQQKVSGVL